MSERGFVRASWGSFLALVGVLALIGSCSGSSNDPEQGATPETTESVAATTPPSTSAATDTTTSTVTTEPAAVMPPDGNPATLAEWNQLTVDSGQLVAADGVVPYALNSPLFSDYAHKLRTVWLPDGADAAAYQEDDSFDFPVGTVVTKTFYYPEPEGAVDGRVTRTEAPSGVESPLDLDAVRLIETRVLVHRDDGWHGLPYLWNAEETEATLERTGAIVQLSLVDAEDEQPFTYVVPDVNQCSACHATNHSTGAVQTIGLQARHLAVESPGGGSQLDDLVRLGLLTGLPADGVVPAAVWNDDSASLEARARAYLDINCAHCHNPDGAADTSGLFLDHETEVGFSFGVCKPPVAAGSGTGGRQYDIWPGQPDESILVYRLESTEPDKMMPELGRSVAHDEGVDVIAEWIASLDGDC